MSKISAWMQAHRRGLLIGGPTLLILGMGAFYLLNNHQVSTDDAYIKAATVFINSNVPGQVSKISVHDNQSVKQGEILFQLDTRPYQLAVARAKAELNSAYLAIQTLKTIYQEKTAEVQAAQDNLTYEREELARQEKMATSGLSSQMRLNEAKNAFNNATQQLIVTQQQQANALAQLNGNADIPAEQLPSAQAALAHLHQALLNLSYATIKAPINGIVTKVDHLQPGNYVRTGEPAFVLVSEHDVWVEANFKENQITNIQPGQTVSIVIDAYPHKKWTGHVMSQSPGTGSTFSLLPPENATGNWVKIVQRLPMRISIDNPNNEKLAAGLSVIATVDTSSTHE